MRRSASESRNPGRILSGQTRRTFLQWAAGLLPVPAFFGLWSAGGSREHPAATAELIPTPECGDDYDATPEQTEGPYFTPRSPERQSLIEPGLVGTSLVLTGRVLSTRCEPIANALLDFWHADDGGAYDNEGYRLRGHQFSDANGRFRLETIVPGLYPGRTRHIHVKVQAPDQRVLTTQLYFPDEPGNSRDGIYSPRLQMDVRDEGNGKSAAFDFVLQIA